VTEFVRASRLYDPATGSRTLYRFAVRNGDEEGSL
jgi:hypothetical protein